MTALIHSRRAVAALLAAGALAGMLRGADDVAALVKKLDSSDELVVREAAQALHDLGPDAAGAVDALIEIINRDDDRNRMPAVFALIGIGPKAAKAVPVLIEATRHKTDFHTQYQACRALGAIGPQAKSAVPALIELFNHGAPSVRSHAALALGGIGPEIGGEAIERLITALGDRNQVVRQRAVLALGMLGPAAKSALPAIDKSLAEGAIDARVDAVESIYKISGDKQRVMPMLVAEIAGEDAPEQAADVLAAFGDAAAPAIPKLAEQLKSDNPLVRYNVAVGLGRLGSLARSAVPALKMLADDPQPEVREVAAEAIALIEKDKP
jgi:HEAT repeat protein